jgi:hypothetical protein
MEKNQVMRCFILGDIKRDLKNSIGDHVHTIVKTGLSALPFGVGGVAAELFSFLIEPPISKRRDKWLVQLAEGLEELRHKQPGFDLDSLRENEIFITSVLHATQAAIRNHHEEKLLALRNTVLNSAIQVELDESMQLMFINMIDTMTPWHLKILLYFQDPAEWFVRNQKEIPNAGTPSQALEAAFTELRGRRSFYDIIIKDLNNQGLLNIDSLHVMMTSHGTIAKRTSPFGDSFVSYVSSPI